MGGKQACRCAQHRVCRCLAHVSTLQSIYGWLAGAGLLTLLPRRHRRKREISSTLDLVAALTPLRRGASDCGQRAPHTSSAQTASVACSPSLAPPPLPRPPALGRPHDSFCSRRRPNPSQYKTRLPPNLAAARARPSNNMRRSLSTRTSELHHTTHPSSSTPRHSPPPSCPCLCRLCPRRPRP